MVVSGNPAGNLRHDRVTLNSTSGLPVFTISSTTTMTGTNRLDVRDVIARAVKNDYMIDYDGFSGTKPNILNWSNFEIESFGDVFHGGLVVSYDFRNVAWSSILCNIDDTLMYPRSDRLYRAVLRFEWDFSYRSALGPLADGAYTITGDNVISATRTYELLSAVDNHQIHSDYNWPVDSGEGYTQPVVLSPFHLRTRPGPLNKPSEFMLSPKNILTDNGDWALNTFAGFVHSIHDDIRPACCLSANDAMKGYHSDSNLIESIPDLPKLLHTVKDVAKLGKLLKDIAQLKPRAIPETIDFLSNLYLAWKYGLSPTISDIEHAHKMAERYVEQLKAKSLELPKSLYGRFSYRIPECPKDMPGKVIVTVRSKMVLRNSPAGVLATIIALDEVGLMPSLTRIWDLVPFSFVVDWFTNLDDRYQDIDNAAIRMALDVDYYIHTFTYRFEPAYAFYAPLQRMSDGNSHLRVFIRERSLIHPTFQSSRFDFHPPTNLKNRLMAAGALLWST
jgi:hypothetical protein